MANGKILEFFKSNWHYFVFGLAVFAGVLCGVRSCSKLASVDVDAKRNSVVIQLSKSKSN